MAGPFGARATTATDEELLAHFELIALRRDFVRAERAVVLKWAEPLRLHVARHAEVEEDGLALLKDHMAVLDEATGLGVSYVETFEASNFRVLFIDEADFLATTKAFYAGGDRTVERIVDRANCLTVFQQDAPGSGVLVRATVIIPVDKAARGRLLARCILEETTQSLGLVADSPDVGRSLFNTGTDVVELNDHDLTLLRLLYHPRMRPGMTPEDALSTAREILPGLR